MTAWFEGKVALVTGGSKGIGKATALALAREGCSIAIAARKVGELEAAAREIEDATGRPVLGVPTDMGHAEEVQHFVDAAVERFGRIDILVNNAGAARRGSAIDVADEHIVHAIEVKLLGYIRAARAVVPHMRAVGGGRIVAIGGGSGTSPGTSGTALGIVNAGIANFMKGLADTVAGENILVNTIHPGLIITPRMAGLRDLNAKQQGVTPEEIEKQMARDIPVGFIAGPEAVADMVVYLASDKANYITGATISIDGGTRRYAF